MNSNTITSLPNAILSFAFTGVMGPHKTGAADRPQRAVSTAQRVFIKPPER
jgi:hypothetical protein